MGKELSRRDDNDQSRRSGSHLVRLVSHSAPRGEPADASSVFKGLGSIAVLLAFVLELFSWFTIAVFPFFGVFIGGLLLLFMGSFFGTRGGARTEAPTGDQPPRQHSGPFAVPPAPEPDEDPYDGDTVYAFVDRYGDDGYDDGSARGDDPLFNSKAREQIYITDWQSAERSARAYMDENGRTGARLTAAGADGGIDVISNSAIAQVKHYARPVGRPPIEQLKGATHRKEYRGRSAIFFSTSGYTEQARKAARELDVELYELSTWDRWKRVR